jgi:hypothetical protein
MKTPTIHSLCIVVDLQVAVNDTERFSVAMQTQQMFPLILLSSYKVFGTAGNIINVFSRYFHRAY